MDNLIFAQAVSRLRCLENKLLEKTKIERMIESSSPKETIKVLQDTSYNVYIGSLVKKPEDYELMLSEELKNLYKLMYEISPIKEIVDINTLKYDYHNIKVILKGKALSKNLDYLLIPIGTVPIDSLKECIEEERYNEINPIMKEAIELVIKNYEDTEDPQVIDIILDSYLYKNVFNKSKEIDNEYIKKYLSVNVDIINIKTFFRVKNQKKDRNFLDKVLIDGGYINKEVFEEGLLGSIDDFVNQMTYTEYYNIVKIASEEYSKTGKILSFEKATDNYIMSIIKEAKYISFGPEPMLAYMYAKENEIKIIRIIMVGKFNNIAPDIIRERLRDIYE